MAKSKHRYDSRSTKSKSVCECREYVFRKGQLVCKRCGKPMKSEKKPISNKGARYQSRYYDK